MKDYVVDNDLDVNTMDISTFEEKVLSVLIKREAKKDELNRTNPRTGNKNKSNKYNQNDQMKFGDQINASQYQNYDRGQWRSRCNNYQGDYNRNKSSRYGNKNQFGNGRNDYNKGRNPHGKGGRGGKSKRTRFDGSVYNSNRDNRDNNNRNKNNQRKWKPFKVCKDPSYARFRRGQTSNNDIKHWIRNCDLRALVYEKKCRKCNIYGHHDSSHNWAKKIPHLIDDLKETSRKIWKAKQKSGGKHANSIQDNNNNNDNDKNGSNKSTNKNAQGKRGKQGKANRCTNRKQIITIFNHLLSQYVQENNSLKQS